MPALELEALELDELELELELDELELDELELDELDDELDELPLLPPSLPQPVPAIARLAARNRCAIESFILWFLCW